MQRKIRNIRHPLFLPDEKGRYGTTAAGQRGNHSLWGRIYGSAGIPERAGTAAAATKKWIKRADFCESLSGEQKGNIGFRQNAFYQRIPEIYWQRDRADSTVSFPGRGQEVLLVDDSGRRRYGQKPPGAGMAAENALPLVRLFAKRKRMQCGSSGLLQIPL